MNHPLWHASEAWSDYPPHFDFVASLRFAKDPCFIGGYSTSCVWSMDAEVSVPTVAEHYGKSRTSCCWSNRLAAPCLDGFRRLGVWFLFHRFVCRRSAVPELGVKDSNTFSVSHDAAFHIASALLEPLHRPLHHLPRGFAPAVLVFRITPLRRVCCDPVTFRVADFFPLSRQFHLPFRQKCQQRVIISGIHFVFLSWDPGGVSSPHSSGQSVRFMPTASATGAYSRLPNPTSSFAACSQSHALSPPFLTIP